MKFTTLTLIAVALVVGCSKPAPTGTVASNTPAASQGSTTGSTTSSTDPGTTSSTTASPATGTATGAPAATPGKPPVTAPGTSPTVPGKAPSATAAATGTPGAPGAAVPGAQPGQPQMTAQQQAQMEKARAKAMKAMKENGEKADKATRSTIAGVSGTYIGFIDEAKITAEMRKQPGFDEQLAKAKEEVKKASVTIAANGDVTLKGMGPEPVTGFSTKIDGKPAMVFTVPKPQPGMPAKQFAPVILKDSGNIIVIGRFTFKKG